jgi:starch-binding outer membrane protein, SusD/RagB family
MKKIFSLLLIAGLLLMISCEDFLVQTPSYALPVEESIETVDDLQNAVNGVYARLNAYDYYSGDFFPLGDLRADVMTNILDYNQISPMTTYQYSKNSSYAEAFWSAPYVTIARVNDVLSVADNIVTEADETDRYNDLIGQLYALRALCHFDLARIFAQLPTALHDDVTMDSPDSGIPISDRVFPVEYKPTRNTLRDVYEFILADFDRSIERLDQTPGIMTSYGYINIWAAKALKARVQLYLGNNAEAFSLAEDVINHAGPSGYRLAEVTEYYNMWASVSQPEFLFEVATTLLYNAQRNSLGYYADPEGYGEFGVPVDFATWLLSLSTDIRSLMVSIKVNSQGSGRGYYCNKYPGREESLYVNNPKVIRMAEVYLIASEAAFHVGDQTNAIKYINNLRRKRLVVANDLTSVTLTNILDERKKELFAEGQRSWDVWRNKLSLVNPRFTAGAIAYDNYRTLVAIPQRETDISPELKQNPGWD